MLDPMLLWLHQEDPSGTSLSVDGSAFAYPCQTPVPHTSCRPATFACTHRSSPSPLQENLAVAVRLDSAAREGPRASTSHARARRLGASAHTCSLLPPRADPGRLADQGEGPEPLPGDGVAGAVLVLERGPLGAVRLRPPPTRCAPRAPVLTHPLCVAG